MKMKNMYLYFSLRAALAQTTLCFVWMEKQNVIKVLIKIDRSPQTWNG